MNHFSENWQPNFGEIVSWFAMDKNGYIALMVNNCFGDVPRVLLGMPDAEIGLDLLNEYMWEESQVYKVYPRKNNGKTVLDLYSSCVYKDFGSREIVEKWIGERSASDQGLREYNLPSIKGLFVYHAVEGSYPGQDYPVGYSGETEMGDYFRYLMPTVFCTIDDFPVQLRKFIMISKEANFCEDRIFKKSSINNFFVEHC